MEQLYRYNAKLNRVVDGDTIVLDVDLGFDITHKITVRLNDIDTNEVHGVKKDSEEYAKGIEQSNFVKNLLNENTKLVFHSLNYNGKYGRVIGDIHIEGVGMLTEALKKEFPHLNE